MERQWQIFEEGPAVQNTGGFHVTLSQRGHFYLNGHAVEALGRPDAVVLMYDPRRSTIGIARTAPDRRHAFRLKRKQPLNSKGRLFFAGNFCRVHGIAPEETLSFIAAEVDKNGILILDLNEVRSVRRS